MISPTISARRLGGLGLLFMMSALAGCSFDEAASCSTSDDCYDGRVCIANLCQYPDGIDLGADQSVDPDQAVDPDQSPDMSVDPDVPPDLDMRPDLSPDFGPDPDLGPDPDMPPDIGLDIGVDSGPDPDMAPDMTVDPDMELDMAPDMVVTPDMDLDMPVDMPPVDMPVDMPDMQDMAPDMMPPPDMGPDMDMGADMAPDMSIIGPQIAVTPSGRIDYGNVAVGATVTDTITVTNVGDAPLVITQADLTARPSQAFDVTPVVGTMAVLTLVPGASQTFTASFTPSSRNNFNNSVFFASNDADDPRVQVDLRGAGTNKTNQICLNSSPDALDFGVVAPGSQATRDVTLVNCGNNQPVTVTQLNINPNGPFSIVGGAMTPFAIPVNQTRTVQIRFAPMTRDEVDAELRINSDSQLGPLQTVDLMGSGGGCAEAIAMGQVQSAQMWPTQPSAGPLVSMIGDSVDLEGGMSSAPSGQLGHAWSLPAKPAMSMASIQGAMSSQASFTADKSGVYRAKLDVTDLASGQPGCNSAQVELVTLSAEPAIFTTATWTSNHDFDLHIMRRGNNGQWPALGDQSNDLSYEQQEQEWGLANSRLDNGFHLGDSTGAGSEGALVGQLQSGRAWRVVVNFSRPLSIQPATVDLVLSVRLPNGSIIARTLSRTFGPQEIRRAWLAFEIDDQGNVTQPNSILP
jgi:hypothetical protein